MTCKGVKGEPIVKGNREANLRDLKSQYIHILISRGAHKFAVESNHTIITLQDFDLSRLLELTPFIAALQDNMANFANDVGSFNQTTC